MWSAAVYYILPFGALVRIEMLFLGVVVVVVVVESSAVVPPRLDVTEASLVFLYPNTIPFPPFSAPFRPFGLPLCPFSFCLYLFSPSSITPPPNSLPFPSFLYQYCMRELFGANNPLHWVWIALGPLLPAIIIQSTWWFTHPDRF